MAEHACCYCPEYEEHAFKQKRCRNCFHPDSCHDATGCHFDPGAARDSMGYVTGRPDSAALAEQPRTVSGNFSLANRKSAMSHRGNVAEEILTTERQYVQSLGELVKLYVAPCRDQQILPQADQLTLFSNVESIRQLNEELLARLEKSVAAWSETAKLADVFTKLGPMLRLYKVYASNYQNATALLHSLAENPQWLDFCRTSQGNPAATPSQVTLVVASLLILPIQRVPRYMLLLHDLLKHTDSQHADYEDLRKAVTLLDEIAAELNTYMQREEETSRVLTIQQSLLGREVPVLFEAHRKFVKEGDVRKVTSRFECNCHLFVFNDIIVYSHGRVGPYYRFNGTIELGTTWTRSLDDTVKLRNLFQIVAPQKTWTFYTTTVEEKQQWITDINALVEDLVRNDPSLRDKRAAEARVKIRGGIWKHISTEKRCMIDSEFAAQEARRASANVGAGAVLTEPRPMSMRRDDEHARLMSDYEPAGPLSCCACCNVM
eukprot:TRINITY_DN6209_c0_g2_i1.p1 TRINITY_DN6209_c0_g2~~TRINITY_DN6209_c0_g2_i1.p1  ORF type:complete len:490 (+),score=130.13 TRINITY_DN6209_c0_g2_i1:80-1549(+)